MEQETRHIDELEGDFPIEARKAQTAGDHMIGGNITAASWIARTCGMSVTSAADRRCVGEQLQSLPKIVAALSSGEIGYQSASVLCHLREQLGEKCDLFDEDHRRAECETSLSTSPEQVRVGIDEARQDVTVRRVDRFVFDAEAIERAAIDIADDFDLAVRREHRA